MRAVEGTNTRRYALTGVASGVISVPATFIHSLLSMINKKDYENTINLITNFVTAL